MAALTHDINKLVLEHVKSLLESIAATYNLNEKELKEKYMGAAACSVADAQDSCSSNIVGDATEKKKRGRKKKQKDEYIETEEYEYEGVKYLVDGNNNVYTYNIEEPMLIGEKLVDGTVKKFSTS
jgi:hypothetical protein